MDLALVHLVEVDLQLAHGGREVLQVAVDGDREVFEDLVVVLNLVVDLLEAASQDDRDVGLARRDAQILVSTDGGLARRRSLSVVRHGPLGTRVRRGPHAGIDALAEVLASL